MNTKPFASKNASQKNAALKSILGLAISLAVLAIAVGSASAGCIGVITGTDYRCGDTVVESCIFNENLVCPAGVHGLSVGADDITIDCYNATLGEYFKITGSENAVSCECPFESSPQHGDCGIYNYKHDNVVIKNLEVKNFCHGILLKGASENKVVNNTIESCKVHDNGNESTGCFTHGILLIHTRNSKVDNNEVYNNTGEVTTACSTGGHGIKLFKFSNYNNITNNEVYKNSVAGIYAKKECEYNYAAYNELYENGEFVGGPTEIGCVAHDGTVYKCGDMVVQSCTFTGDMSCPSGHGLEIGEDNIVIDGNGYVITGDRSDCSGCDDETNQIGCSCGILNRGYDNVTIKNLEVTNFCNGIVIRNKGSNLAENNTINNCTVHDNGAEGSCAAGVGYTHGIHLLKVTNSTIIENEVYNNTGCDESSCCAGGMGICLRTACIHNNITDNQIHDNAHSGIYSKACCEYNNVTFNHIYENGHIAATAPTGGIVLRCKRSDNWIFENNRIEDNYGPGMFIGGHYNTIRNNTITGSKSRPNGDVHFGHGIHFGRSDSGSFYNNLLNNTVCDNEDTDICVCGGCPGNTGDENTCDTTENYDDDGTEGCTYPCASLSLGISGGVNEHGIKINMAGVMTSWYDFFYSLRGMWEVSE